MLAIKVDNEILDLAPGTSLELQQENPYLQVDQQIAGDYSLPFDVRCTPKNMRLLGFPGLLQATVPNTGIEAGIFDGGLQHSTGKIKVEKANINVNLMAKGNVSLYYLTGSSSFLQDIKDVKLRDVDLGGMRQWMWDGYNYSGSGFWAHINRVLVGTETADYAFFPVIDKKFDGDTTRTHLLNAVIYEGGQPRLNRWGTTFDGSNALVPFPYLKYVLQKAFAQVGWNVQSEIFSDADFNKIVLINFKAIAWSWMNKVSVGWEIKPYDLCQFNLQEQVPDITIAEFLIALKNRLGWWYDFDKKAKIVYIKKIRSVINSAVKDFSAQASPLVTKTVSKEVKLYALRNQFVGEYANGQPSINNTLYQGQVASRDLLPPATESNYSQVYLVNRDNNYYMCRQNLDTGGYEWQIYAYNVYDYEPTGANESITTACTTVGNEYWNDYIYSAPRMEFKGDWYNFSDAEGDWNTILCFAHGLRETPGGELLPFGSSGIYDMLGNKIAEWSLAFEHPTVDGGDAGLVATAWNQTLEIFNGNEEVEVTLYLDKTDYLNLRFSDIIVIRNVRLYLKTVKSVLPYKNVLTATCIRV